MKLAKFMVLRRNICLIIIYEYIFTLHFRQKNTQTKITRSPDTNIPESSWEYKITNNNIMYIKNC